MRYIFDSDAITALLRPTIQDNARIYDFIAGLDDPEFFLSILTIYEFEYNIACAPDDQKEQIRLSLEVVYSQFEVLNLGRNDAQVYGRLKEGFRQKTGINKNALKRHSIDITLAGVAIANNCILISNDKIYSHHLQAIEPRLQTVQWKK